MKIFLVRHGESTMNTGENLKLGHSDHMVDLTEEGRKQAQISGEKLRQYLLENNIKTENSRVWVSHYKRTRQTAAIISNILGVNDVREDSMLIEQQYGLFDGVPQEEWSTRFPTEFEHYNRWCSQGGKYYARMPQGESPFDVAQRLRIFFGTINRDLDNHGIDTIFVVTHGITTRVFVKEWLHLTPEWYFEQKNPGNCAIRFIDGKNDLGFIFSGFSAHNK